MTARIYVPDFVRIASSKYFKLSTITCQAESKQSGLKIYSINLNFPLLQ